MKIRALFLLSLLLLLACACGESPLEPQDVPVASVSVTPQSLEMTVGGTASLKAAVSPSNATEKTISWKSSNSAVVTVSGNGELSAKSEGTATVTATAGGKSGAATITVIPSTVPVASVEVKPSLLDIFIGEEGQLTATVLPADATDKTVTWTSSDPSVATVAEGTVKGFKEGTATVTAAAGGKKATCLVTVNRKDIPVEAVSLDKHELQLYAGESYTLSVTIRPENATDKSISWASSDPMVATVQSGTVPAVGKGETAVTATSSNGIVASCRIVVSERFGAVDMGLSVKWANMNLGAADSSEGGSFYAWGELTPKSDYSWQTYKYASGTIDSINKYGDLTDSYLLTDEDDAAHFEKGGSWRIPTKQEFRELIDNCDVTWSDSPAGYMFTSKVNGNKLFFPKSGYMEGTSLDVNYFCYARYWTASTGSYDGEAAYVGFYNPSFDMSPGLNSAERCMGYSIRPVEGGRLAVPEAKVLVEGVEFDFGMVKVGETGRIDVTVRNVGDAELSYHVGLPQTISSTDNFSENITIWGNTYGAALTHTLAAGESDTFTILYKPVEAGKEEYSKFYVYTDAVNGNKCLTVRGKSPGGGGSNEDVGYGDWDF